MGPVGWGGVRHGNGFSRTPEGVYWAAIKPRLDRNNEKFTTTDS